MLGYISWLCGTNLHSKIKMATFDEKMEVLCNEGKLAGVVLVAGDRTGEFLGGGYCVYSFELFEVFFCMTIRAQDVSKMGKASSHFSQINDIARDIDERHCAIQIK